MKDKRDIETARGDHVAVATRHGLLIGLVTGVSPFAIQVTFEKYPLVDTRVVRVLSKSDSFVVLR